MKIRVAVFASWVLITANCLADYQVSIPAGRTVLLANQLNNGANTLADIFGRQLPALSGAYFWECCNENPTNIFHSVTACISTYVYDPSDPAGLGPDAPLWYENNDSTPANPSNITVAPGQGVFIHNNGPTILVTFQGTGNIPVLPATLPCGFGHYNLLSRQTNDAGTYENITGYAPSEGAQVLRWNSGPANFTTYAFSSGVWTPGTPALAIGEAAFFLVPNGINLSCPSNLVVEACANTPVFYAPNATSSACANVTVVCTPPSGTVFTLGTTTPVHCVATDCGGNSTTCDFTVTVTGPLVTITHTVSITWAGSGILQQADQPNGPWMNVPGGNVSPCVIPADAQAKFYRVQCN